MILLWLAVVVATMAALVAWRFSRLVCSEPSGSPARIMMIGIVCAAVGVLCVRIYWLPWYWAQATGAQTAERYQVLETFWSTAGDYHLWGVYAGMCLYVIGLHFHLNVSRLPNEQLQALRGLILIMLAAGIVPLVAWMM